MPFMRYAAFLSAASLALSAPLHAQNSEGTTVPQPTSPPTAEKRDHSYSHHGITISDPYHWLRDQSYPTIDDEDMLDHLKAENAWFEARMKPQQPLVDELFAEMKARIKEDDSTVPQKGGDWLYWSEFEEGAEYRKYYRKPVAGGDDVLILDENALAEGVEYFRLGAFSVSQNGRYLAYSADTNGSERFTARIKDLETGELLPDEIPGTLSGLVWVKGDTALVYGLCGRQLARPRCDPARHRHAGQRRRRTLPRNRGRGLPRRHRPDRAGRLAGHLDRRQRDERSPPGLRPTIPPAEQVLVKPRQKGVEYDVDVRDGMVWVHTNDNHVNFRLATAKLETPGDWTTLISGSDEFYLTGFELFKDFYVTEGRLRGLDQIQLRSYKDANLVKPIAFAEASFSAGLSNNPEYDQDTLRLAYESMVTPDSVYDYHVATGELELLKQQEIPSGYDPALYTTERVEIAARDGTMVPVSIIMRKDRPKTGPLHLYAYGAYGYAVPPGFSTSRLSLVDRGYAYAIAHIRGGDDLGRKWYLQGKLNERTNTFNDFVDVAKGLVAKGYTEKGRISISGGSAGGELMGAVVNTDPDLWGAVVADVPFVDVLNTMLDKDLPLTPGEWPEWGNPILSKQAFAYILSYSPYDQVTAQDYPPMLVTAGLNDPRVTYWEPAKWVAKLREVKTGDSELLLKTNMGAGHGGKSGRFQSIYETAEEVAFILWQMGEAE